MPDRNGLWGEFWSGEPHEDRRTIDADADALALAPISQIMRRRPETLAPHLPVRRASELLTRSGLTAAPVAGANRIPVGFVGVDVLLEAEAELGESAGRDAPVCVADVMTEPLHLSETSSIAHAAGLMHSRGVADVAAVDVRGRLVGVVSASDIARYLAESTGFVPAVADDDVDAPLLMTTDGVADPSVIANERLRPVLVIDDDAAVCDGLVEILEEEGFHTVRALDGRQALDLLSHMPTQPGLILLDLMMPRLNGWEFRQRQLRDERLRGIPVVVLTARGRRMRWEELGSPAAVLPKPIGLQTLIDVVETYYEPVS